MPLTGFEPGTFRLRTSGITIRPLGQLIITILHFVYRFKDQMAFSSEYFEPVILTLRYYWIVKNSGYFLNVKMGVKVGID